MKKLYLTFFLFAFAMPVLCSEYSEEKSYAKRFACQPNTSLEVENKYGDIEYAAWDKDSVAIDVIVTVVASDFQDTYEMLEAIEVNFRQAGSFIIAETSWNEDVNFFKKKVLQIGQTFSGNDRIQVDYKISGPSYISLDLRNKFGNVFIGNHEGSFNLELSHGDLRARDLMNVSKCEVSYGKVKINKIKGGKLECSFVENGRIERMEDVRFKGTTSDLVIEEAVNLVVESRHDDLTIEEVTNFEFVGSLSDVVIESASGKFQATCKLGSLNVESVKSDIEGMSIEGSATDVSINFLPTWKGQITTELTNSKGSHLLHSGMKRESESVMDKTTLTRYKLNGGTTSRVSITMKGGYLNIGE